MKVKVELLLAWHWSKLNRLECQNHSGKAPINKKEYWTDSRAELNRIDSLPHSVMRRAEA
jgi:hypothetical protein